jgi:hypothetical protein
MILGGYPPDTLWLALEFFLKKKKNYNGHCPKFFKNKKIKSSPVYNSQNVMLIYLF